MNKFIRDNASLLAVSWGHFVNDFYMSLVPVVLVIFARELSLSATETTMILFVITTAGTFFQPIVGLLIDKVQKSVLLIYALIGISIGMSISGFISNFYLLMIVVGIAAIGSSIYHPLGSTITIHKTGFSRGKSLSIFMTVGSFAHSAPPIIAIPIVSKYGLNSLAFFMIPGLLTALLLYVVKVHKVTWTKSETKEKNDKKSSRKLLTRNQQFHLTIPMTIAVVKGVLYRTMLVFSVFIMGLKGIDELIVAPAILTGFMIARAISTLVGGFISDEIGERNTLKLFNGLALVAILMFTYGSNVIMMIGLVILGFSLNGTAAANVTITHRIVPNNVNYGTGLIMGFAATLSAVAMLGYGVIVDVFDHLLALNVLVLLTALMTLLSFLIPKEY